MPLIADRVGQLVWDGIADSWLDVHTAAQRDRSVYDRVSDTDAPDVETDLGLGAEQVDVNIAQGLQFSPLIKPILSDFLEHIQGVGGYGTIRQYAAARRWRAHLYAADLGWADAQIASALDRTNVCPELTNLCSHLHTTGHTAIGGIPATAGAARLRALVDAKGAVNPWTPDIHAVCEGPTTSLDGGLTSDETDAITVVDTSDFPATGHIIVDDEAIAYGGKTPTSFTTLTRAQYGTAAAAHNTGTAVYKVHTYTPTIRVSAREGLLVDLDVAALTSLSSAGGTTLNSTGIGSGTPNWQVGNYILVKDHTSPELLTEDCLADDELHVADASAFRPGDYIRIVDDTPTDEWATIHDVDHNEGLILLDAPTLGNFAVADNAFVCLAFTTINEGGLFAHDDMPLTVTDASGFPTSGTLLIDDEEITYTNVVGNDITITARGANGTTAVAHEDGTSVLLVQEGTFPGHNEWHILSAVNTDDLVTNDALIHSYFEAAFVVPLLRDVVLTEDGADGDAGDAITIQAHPDRLISKAG